MKKITLLLAFINLAISSFSQNVGIGLTTPTAKLQINSTSTASRPLLLLSDSISGTSNTIEFTKQGIINKWSLSSILQSNNFNSSIRFGFTGGVTPFTLTGDGKVGINSISPLASLDVNSPWAQTAIFHGGDQMYISLVEQGNYRGYIGSFSGNAEDVDFGAHSDNPTGKVHLITGATPRLTVTPNGNIGIGTQNPAEKLDVQGSINVTQTIKANGVAGEPGQVLSLNSNGNIAWADINEFKNHRTLEYRPDLLIMQWAVPAGVTRIMVEGWGGGGGGSSLGGGGGGGYVCGWYSVIPGNVITFQIGKYGEGATDGYDAEDGGDTRITTPSTYIIADGGKRASGYNLGKGGGYLVGSGSIGRSGEDGQPNRLEYYQSNATTFLEATIGGKGGDAGNTLHTGAAGGYRLKNTSTNTDIKRAHPSMAGKPGGGGAGNYIGALGPENFSTGSNGSAIIHY